jgi:hypothetical protein
MYQNKNAWQAQRYTCRQHAHQRNNTHKMASAALPVGSIKILAMASAALPVGSIATINSKRSTDSCRQHRNQKGMASAATTTAVGSIPNIQVTIEHYSHQNTTNGKRGMITCRQHCNKAIPETTGATNRIDNGRQTVTGVNRCDRIDNGHQTTPETTGERLLVHTIVLICKYFPQYSTLESFFQLTD